MSTNREKVKTKKKEDYKYIPRKQRIDKRKIGKRAENKRKQRIPFQEEDSFVTWRMIISKRDEHLLKEFKKQCADQFEIIDEPTAFNGKFIIVPFPQEDPDKLQLRILLNSKFLDEFKDFANTFWRKDKYQVEFLPAEKSEKVDLVGIRPVTDGVYYFKRDVTVVKFLDDKGEELQGVVVSINNNKNDNLQGVAVVNRAIGLDYILKIKLKGGKIVKRKTSEVNEVK